MAEEIFPASALAENRQRRLTPEQVKALQADAKVSKQSGGTAGLWLLLVGALLLGGTIAGRVPGSKLQSLAVGAAIAGIGVFLLISQGRTRGVVASEIVSGSTILDTIEGPIRREQYDRQPAADLLGSGRNIRGDARYHFYLHIGGRRFDVGRPAYEAAPHDGVVRAYVLPDSDRLVNLERIGDAPPTPIAAQAQERMKQLFGSTTPEQLASMSAAGPQSAAALRQVLIGRWHSQGLGLSMEFRADGTVAAGDETKRWEALDGSRIRMDGQEQRIAVQGDAFVLVTQGPALRFTRIP